MDRGVQLELSQIERRYDHLRIHDRAGFGALCDSLATHGQQSPLLVVAGDEADTYILIDGHARMRAMERLGWDVCGVVVLALDEIGALILCQQLGRHSDALEQAWLVGELIERHGWTPTQVATQLGRTPSWISRRLALVRVLPQSVQQAVRSGQIVAHAAMKALVPLARANKSHCERLVAAVGRTHLSVRQWEALYGGWRRAEPAERERIVAEPLLYLKVIEAAELDAGADAMGGASEDLGILVHKDLGVIAAVCRRARRRLCEASEIRRPVRGDIRRSFAEAKLAFASLAAAIDDDEEDDDARSRHAQRDLTATA
jgi:ParB/RepB/Spo0J family partition protein